jgi:hypothetical protein
MPRQLTMTEEGWLRRFNLSVAGEQAVRRVWREDTFNEPAMKFAYFLDKLIFPFMFLSLILKLVAPTGPVLAMVMITLVITWVLLITTGSLFRFMLAAFLGNREMMATSNSQSFHPLSFMAMRVRYNSAQTYSRVCMFVLAVLLAANLYIVTAVFTALAGLVILISNEVIRTKAQRALDLAESEGPQVDAVVVNAFDNVEIHRIQ